MYMLISRAVAPPAGTFLAPVRNGVIQLPPPMKLYCDTAGWSLFRFIVLDDDHLTMQPVLPDVPNADFHASLGADGRLWIPAELREAVSLGEQSVMLRIENGAIGMYLRKVFDTLGFRPR
jgi:hypothetical protein